MTKEKPKSDAAIRDDAGRPLFRRARPAPVDPDVLAAQALAFIAEDPDLLSAFLALTGLGPDSLRESVGTAAFTRGMLDHVMGDEALLVSLAAHLGLPPDAIAGAAHRLAGTG